MRNPTIGPEQIRLNREIGLFNLHERILSFLRRAANCQRESAGPNGPFGQEPDQLADELMVFHCDDGEELENLRSKLCPKT